MDLSPISSFIWTLCPCGHKSNSRNLCATGSCSPRATPSRHVIGIGEYLTMERREYRRP